MRITRPLALTIGTRYVPCFCRGGVRSEYGKYWLIAQFKCSRGYLGKCHHDFVQGRVGVRGNTRVTTAHVDHVSGVPRSVCWTPRGHVGKKHGSEGEFRHAETDISALSVHSRRLENPAWLAHFLQERQARRKCTHVLLPTGDWPIDKYEHMMCTDTTQQRLRQSWRLASPYWFWARRAAVVVNKSNILLRDTWRCKWGGGLLA